MAEPDTTQAAEAAVMSAAANLAAVAHETPQEALAQVAAAQAAPPAAPVRKPITKADDQPYGRGGSYVLLPSGVRVTAARFEESQK